MSGQGVLEKARKLFRKKRFSDVITLLEPNVINYRESFPCFYMLGVSCMYMGDMGGAASYLQRARQIKMRDPELLVAQAAMHLRRGDTNDAVEYYLEALEYEPGNNAAKKALQFIRRQGDPDTISAWIDSGKIQRFYPKTGKPNPAPYVACVLAVLVIGAAAFIYKDRAFIPPLDARADLSGFALTGAEKSAPAELGGTYRYILTDRQITDAYAAAQTYFNDFRDNAAQVEINRILYSNASPAIRQKTRLLMDYLAVPGFDTLKDNYTWAQVSADPYLYLDCYVIWSGRITNVATYPSSWECDFLIGYDDFSKIDGIVPVRFMTAPSVTPDRPLKIFGKVSMQDGRLYLEGRSVYQSVGGAQ